MSRINYYVGLSLILLFAAVSLPAQVFNGSTGTIISSSATPAFSLAAVSSESPIIFTISPTVNVTGPTITNLSSGARFVIRITTDGTHTWSWNGIISDGLCPVYTDGAAITEAHFIVDPNGTTIHGEACYTVLAGMVAYGAYQAAPSTSVSSGNMFCGLTVYGLDCLGPNGQHYVTSATIDIGSGLTAGNIYYISSGGLAAGKADSSTTLSAAMCIAINTTQCARSGQYIYGSSQGWTEGQTLYVSDITSGSITSTQPSASGHYIKVLGTALANGTIDIAVSPDVAGIM